MVPGAAAVDAPVWVDGQRAWFLGLLGESEFMVVTLKADGRLHIATAREAAVLLPLPGGEGWGERDGVLSNFESCAQTLSPSPSPPGGGEHIIASTEWLTRYDAEPGTTYLFRPDQHVCARWRAYDEQTVLAAVARACGKAQST